MITFLLELSRTLFKGAKRGFVAVISAWDYLLYGFVIYALAWLLYFVGIAKPLAVHIISENLAPATFLFFLIISYTLWAVLFLLIALFDIEETSFLFSCAQRLHKLEKFIMALPLIAASQYFAATLINLFTGKFDDAKTYAVVFILIILLAMSFPSMWFLPDSDDWRAKRCSERNREGWNLFLSNLILAAILLFIAITVFAVNFKNPVKFNLVPNS